VANPFRSVGIATLTPPWAQRSSHDTTQNELADALVKRKAAGARVIDLTESNPTRAGVARDDAAILRAIANPRALEYEPLPFGLPRAREEIARRMSVPSSRVVLTASTSEAYAFLFKLLCDPGDEVLVPAPSYPLLSQLAELESVALVPYRLRYDGAWHVDLASARGALSNKSRAVLVVSPNNPTGSCVTEDELAALSSLGPIVCDEVFAPYVFSERSGRVTCAATHARTGLVFSLGGLSKLAGLPQMKLAWIIVGGADPLVEQALNRLAWVADAYLSVAAPVQHALPELLDKSEVTRQAIGERLRKNLGELDAHVRGTAATRLDVEGGWYATLRVPRVRSEMATALNVLERGVYVHPGAFFGFEDEAYLVVSLLTRENEFDEAIPLLLGAL
jgi:alanine-synthesizing transaminase